MKKLTILFAVTVSGIMLISCGKGNATSKVKKENVIKAQERDNDISKGGAALTLSSKEYDFGTVNEGDVVETSFVVTNTGKSNLVIMDAKVTCGCTVPVWPKEAIEPGTSAEVKVRFNTAGKPNKQSKSVTLITNTAKGREVFKLKGMVTPRNKKTNA